MCRLRQSLTVPSSEAGFSHQLNATLFPELCPDKRFIQLLHKLPAGEPIQREFKGSRSIQRMGGLLGGDRFSQRIQLL